MPGLLTLIGSGEVSAGMVKVHRALLDGLDQPRPTFLETPAGFELGVDVIAARFEEYFQTSLGLPLQLARYLHRDDPPTAQAEALAAISQSNYIVAGPGSPTYALEHLRGTVLLGALLERWQAGAQVVFASAATVALGRHALPVYEIYKVGQALHWVRGLDMLGPFGFELAIIPHWDNAEGGTHDTRACFMGMERFARLRALLPPSAVVLGVDEHTAVTLDMAGGTGAVRGKGGVSLLHAAQEHLFESGETFSLDALRPGPPPPDRGIAAAPAMPGPDQVDKIGQAAARIGAGDLPGGLRLAAKEAPARTAALLLQAASAAQNARAGQDELGPLLEILIEIRAGLRERGEWALADGLRDRLLGIGFELRDTPEGTVWARRSA